MGFCGLLDLSRSNLEHPEQAGRWVYICSECICLGREQVPWVQFWCWLWEPRACPGSWTSPGASPGLLPVVIWALERCGASTWARLWAYRASAVSPRVWCWQGRMATPCAAKIGVACGEAWGCAACHPVVGGSACCWQQDGAPRLTCCIFHPDEQCVAKVCDSVYRRLKLWCVQYSGIISFLHIAAVYCASELPKYPGAHPQLQLRMDCFHQLFFFLFFFFLHSTESTPPQFSEAGMYLPPLA